jgi:hypothetical protein
MSFKDFFVVRPQIQFWFDEGPHHYEGKAGTAVDERFEYRSDNNDYWVDYASIERELKAETQQ